MTIKYNKDYICIDCRKKGAANALIGVKQCYGTT